MGIDTGEGSDTDIDEYVALPNNKENHDKAIIPMADIHHSEMDSADEEIPLSPVLCLTLRCDAEKNGDLYGAASTTSVKDSGCSNGRKQLPLEPEVNLRSPLIRQQPKMIIKNCGSPSEESLSPNIISSSSTVIDNKANNNSCREEIAIMNSIDKHLITSSPGRRLSLLQQRTCRMRKRIASPPEQAKSPRRPRSRPLSQERLEQKSYEKSNRSGVPQVNSCGARGCVFTAKSRFCSYHNDVIAAQRPQTQSRPDEIATSVFENMVCGRSKEPETLRSKQRQNVDIKQENRVTMNEMILSNPKADALDVGMAADENYKAREEAFNSPHRDIVYVEKIELDPIHELSSSYYGEEVVPTPGETYLFVKEAYLEFFVKLPRSILLQSDVNFTGPAFAWAKVLSSSLLNVESGGIRFYIILLESANSGSQRILWAQRFAYSVKRFLVPSGEVNKDNSQIFDVGDWVVFPTFTNSFTRNGRTIFMVGFGLGLVVEVNSFPMSRRKPHMTKTRSESSDEHEFLCATGDISVASIGLIPYYKTRDKHVYKIAAPEREVSSAFLGCNVRNAYVDTSRGFLNGCSRKALVAADRSNPAVVIADKRATSDRLARHPAQKLLFDVHGKHPLSQRWKTVMAGVSTRHKHELDRLIGFLESRKQSAISNFEVFLCEVLRDFLIRLTGAGNKKRPLMGTRSGH